MDRRLNPYAPGAGRQPPELAGRDALIERATIDLERLRDGRPTRGMMLVGLRGVGKTVLLNRLLRIAESQGCQTVKIEAPEGGALPELLAPELRRLLYAFDLEAGARHKLAQAVSALRSFAAAFRLTLGEMEFGISPARGIADTGRLQQDLPDLLVAVAEAASERQVAVALFIDELQYLSGDELASVIVACHQISQRDLPLIFIGAGLPQIPALAGEAKSYAERLFEYPEVDRLPNEAARDALIKPARKVAVEFEDQAIAEIVRATEGYPYFIQEWGSHVWDGADASPILLSDVVKATPRVIEHLDANFFRVRFGGLTALQQKYLRAMAELGPGSQKTGKIAATLGVGAAAVATVRQQLIDKGMIWSRRHGETAFTVPMFDAFMRRQMPELLKHVPRRRNPAATRKG